MADTKSKVQQIIAEKLGVDASTITVNASLVDELGADDTSLAELKSALENTFSITIPDEELDKLITVRDVIDFVERNT